MNKFIPLYLIFALLIASVSMSCKKKQQQEEEEVDPRSYTSSSVVVSNFYLTSNDSVLANLDSVHFTIDPTNAVIFNADSLPKGTKIGKMLAEITYASTVSSAQIKITGGTFMKDTIFDYSNTDSIDFTGTVYLSLVSEDKIVSRDWLIKINVHQIESDSLYWDQMARCDLPANGKDVAASHTVDFNNLVMCYTRPAAGKYTLAVTDHPSNEWTYVPCTMPADVNINTITAPTDKLYLLTNEGRLYSSPDGSAWTATGENWFSIIGGYSNRVLGVKYDTDHYVHAEYPAPEGFMTNDIHPDFPIVGASNMISRSFKWSDLPQSVIVGGIMADGTVSGDSWGYDGTKWSLIGEDVIMPHYGMTLFPFYSFAAQSDWKMKQTDTYFAVGGFNALGEVEKCVYTSRDMGANWRVGDQLVTLPEYIEPFAYAQAFVFDTEMLYTRSGSAWTAFPGSNLLPWCFPVDEPATRTVQPPTSWNCPYIYIFGGIDSRNVAFNNIWRGTLNRFTFQPLY